MARCLYVNSFIFQVLMCIIFSAEVTPYEKIFLESAQLCRLKDDGDITVVKLGKGESSAKIVLQSKYFERWSGKYAFSCSFIVRAPSDYGVYAVVQVLNFRKNETSGTCKDYVEFEIPQNSFKIFFKNLRGEKVAKKLCGKVSASESYLSGFKELELSDALSNSAVSENGFVAKDGLIQVTVHVAKERLDPDQKLDISMVFTSYKHDCRKREKSFQCKECEWIWEGFDLDKIQNCPYTTCLDEDFCKNIDAKNGIRNVISSGTGTKVSIGAVATIILGLLMFACCVWLSRRMQLFCFNPAANRQSRMEMNATQRSGRADDNVTPYGGMLPESTAPSAPPISEDKDLPPSYSSLFPGKICRISESMKQGAEAQLRLYRLGFYRRRSPEILRPFLRAIRIIMPEYIRISRV